MFTLIKGAEIYSPEYLGKKDVLIAFDKIAAIGEELELPAAYRAKIVDAEGKLLLPGLIDLHVHITGGGGEGGFSTRTREIDIENIVEGGITTVVGVLGTDGVTRSLEGLYAKAKSLEEQGITTYIYSGSYEVPVKTLTGSIQQDMLLIDKVIGVGEISISDHRSFHPTTAELARIAAEARVGGMLAGKTGIVHFHMGDGKEGLEPLIKVIDNATIPIKHFIPTHINRSARLMEQAVGFTARGGFIDLTAGIKPDGSINKPTFSYDALKQLLDLGVNENNISMSSDGNGSIPLFDENGSLIGIETGSCKVLFEDFKRAVQRCEIPIEKALKTVTSNPARILNIEHCKGGISEGKDADMVIADKSLDIEMVLAKGKKIYKGAGTCLSEQEL